MVRHIHQHGFTAANIAVPEGIPQKIKKGGYVRVQRATHTNIQRCPTCNVRRATHGECRGAVWRRATVPTRRTCTGLARADRLPPLPPRLLACENLQEIPISDSSVESNSRA